ncbi:hypothetical protein BpHYR1_050448 [Brachionus plicatilis]|uniref:PARP4 MVP-ID C-terminal domain-containing protein n=1 Tax=Brachionus plicatilis TaxID=10195 RepID=A0A3M7QQM4_BRAPC|nr:hypothetical protein BpHYR1_050448 [Brachionus plicatilis]
MCSYESSEEESKAFDDDDIGEHDESLSLTIFDSIETTADCKESSVDLDLMENIKEIETNKTDKEIKQSIFGAAENQLNLGFGYIGGSRFSVMKQQPSTANSFSFGSQARGYNRGTRGKIAAPIPQVARFRQGILDMRAKESTMTDSFSFGSQARVYNRGTREIEKLAPMQQMEIPTSAKPKSTPPPFLEMRAKVSKWNFNEIRNEEDEDEASFDFSEGSSSKINIMPLGFEKAELTKKKRTKIMEKKSGTFVRKETDLDSSVSNKKIKVVDTKSLREFIKVNVFELGPNLPAFDKIEVSNYKIKIKECEIDCMPLMNFLVSMGLNSLGEQVADEIKELVIHLIIMVLILRVFSTDRIQITCFQQLNETIEKIIQPSYTGYGFGFVEHVRSFCQRARFLQLKYPNVCDSLELGRNWDKVISKNFKKKLKILLICKDYYSGDLIADFEIILSLLIYGSFFNTIKNIFKI